MSNRLTMRHGAQLVKHVVPAVIKPARTLWHEFIGFIFLCFGAIFGFKTGRLALDFSRSGPADEGGHLVRLVIAGGCTAVMLWFGITSFWKARKISRS